MAGGESPERRAPPRSGGLSHSGAARSPPCLRSVAPLADVDLAVPLGAARIRTLRRGSLGCVAASARPTPCRADGVLREYRGCSPTAPSAPRTRGRGRAHRTLDLNSRRPSRAAIDAPPPRVAADFAPRRVSTRRAALLPAMVLRLYLLKSEREPAMLAPIAGRYARSRALYGTRRASAAHRRPIRHHAGAPVKAAESRAPASAARRQRREEASASAGMNASGHSRNGECPPEAISKHAGDRLAPGSWITRSRRAHATKTGTASARAMDADRRRRARSSTRSGEDRCSVAADDAPRCARRSTCSTIR